MLWYFILILGVFQIFHSCLNLKKITLFLTIALLILVYFLNLGYNDIWNPNEGFYADAVREMFRRNNFLEFYFNNELRFNKPPLTYWSVALSVWLFGLNEFAIRFPMAAMALITIYLTYLTAKRLFGPREGVLAGIMMALSLQFTVNARYSSPEIPLTCFFSMTMYWFIRGYLDKDFRYLLLSYFGLGGTLLAKGYPYAFVIGGIVLLYLCFESNFRPGEVWTRLKRLKLAWGLPIVMIVGFSWPVYMYWLHGDAFFHVLNAETVDRALNYESKGWSSLFFYIEISSWGFLPYSLAFFYALFFFIKNKKLKEVSFPFSWLLVMFVIFTLAKGKLPTYFIQAHGAMAIITARFLAMHVPYTRLNKIMANVTLWFPGLLVLILNIAMVIAFDINYLVMVLVFLPLVLWILLHREQSAFVKKLAACFHVANNFRWHYLKFYPFYSFLVSMLIFSAFVLPQLETYRPYDQIKTAVEERSIKPEVSLWLEDQLLFNLPFYVKRKVVNEKSLQEIENHALQNDQFLALVSEEHLSHFPGTQLLWSGWVYNRNSEAKFFRFVTGYLKAKRGDFSDYRRLCLIYRRSRTNEISGN